MARPIGTSEWIPVKTSTKLIDRSIAFGNSLFVSGLPSDGMAGDGIVMRIVDTEIADVWNSVSGLTSHNEPVFFDDDRELVKVALEGSVSLVPYGLLPVKDRHNPFGHYVVAIADEKLFVNLDGALWTIVSGIAQKTPLSHVKGASDGKTAWFVGELDGVYVVACFSDGEWFYFDEVRTSNHPLIASDGAEACVVSFDDAPNTSISMYSLESGAIIRRAVLSRDVVVSAKCIAWANGKWWFSRRDGLEPISIDHNGR
jgi:hypothetical protein